MIMASTKKEKKSPKDKVVKEKPIKDTPTITPFTILSYLTDKKKKWIDLSVDEKKAFSPWLINRFLSMDMDYVELINSVQHHASLGEDIGTYYTLLLELLPKQRFYAPYIKSKAEKIVWSDELMELASNYLNLSDINISSALTTLSETNQLRDFIAMFGKTEKEIDKLLK